MRDVKSRNKTIYFVRHGQSVDNISPVFQSETSSLSEDGLTQAKFIAERVSHLQFDILISSPLARTKQTAQAIAASTGHVIEYSDLFVERIKPANLSGKPFSDKVAVKLWKEWNDSFSIGGEGIKGSDNYSRILERADKALEYLLSKEESTILVVTHGFFLRVLIARVMLRERLDPEIFSRIMSSTSMENTALSVFKYSDDYESDYQWKLWIHNDHAHLAE